MHVYLERFDVPPLKEPPADYHSWELNPGIFDVIEHQEMYLSNCTLCEDHVGMRTSTRQEDTPEIEVGPQMAMFFVGAPSIGKDEILVFKTVTKNGKSETSVQIEKNFDALTPAEIKIHAVLVEAAIRKEIASFVEHRTFVRALRRDCPNTCTSRWVLRWKEIDGVRSVKARLTIRGFQDSEEVASFASTASRWGQRVIVSISVLMLWDLWTADVSTAFLRGMEFSELARLT
jgi:hypothetical protein